MPMIRATHVSPLQLAGVRQQSVRRRRLESIENTLLQG